MTSHHAAPRSHPDASNPARRPAGPPGGSREWEARSPAPAKTEDRPRAEARRSVEETRTLILETHARIKRDRFEVMGLERTATEAEVRDAYIGFARVLHPDACRDEALADIREKREAVFIRLSEAYETLRDPASRAAYERGLRAVEAQGPSGRAAAESRRTRRARPPGRTRPAPAPPAPTPGPLDSTVDDRLMPERILEVAEALFADGQYWEAIQQLEPMITRAEGPTRARANMLLAKAYLKNPKWKKRAEGVLQSLVQDNPRDVAACLALAELYRDAKLLARARSLYRKVLAVEPGCAEAVSALEELDPPGERVPVTAGLAGLFRRR